MNRSTKLLIALLIVLAVIAYFMFPFNNEREASYNPAIASVAVDSASIIKIEIRMPSNVTTLENIGGRWEVTSPLHAAADPVAVAQLLNGFAQFKLGSLVSSNPDKQRLFQVDSSGTRLTFYDRNGKTKSLIIGKMGPSFSEVYFRLPDSKDVYLGEGIDTWSINKNVKDWRDRTIVRTTSDAFTSVDINIGNRSYILQKDNSGWKSGDKLLETSDINSLLNTLSNFRADDFVDTVIDIKSKPIMLTAKGMDNVSLNLYPVLPDSAKYFVRSTKSSQLYVVSKWSVQQLLKPVDKSFASSKTVEQVAEVQPKETIPTPKMEVPSKKTKVASVKKETTKSQPKIEKPPELTKPVVEPKKEELKKEETKKVEPAPITTPVTTPTKPAQKVEEQKQPQVGEEDGDLIVHTVQKGETMTTIARKYNVTTQQIIKWNLLKTISVKPGQELYIYVKK